MARLSPEQWEEVRAKREAGASFPALGAEFGISHQAIQKRAKAEGWGDGQDVKVAIVKKVAEKVAGVVAGCNPKKKAEAIDAEAGKAAAVVTRHREEWPKARDMAEKARETHANAAGMDDKRVAFEDLKAAKIHAETLKIIQDGERKAWNLDVPVDFSNMTDEQLAALAKGKAPA